MIKRSATSLEKLFTIFEYEFDLTPLEKRELELLVLNFLKEKRKREGSISVEDQDEEWHVMEKLFKKKKRGNKPWLFRCRKCKGMVDDTTDESYWVRYDTGDNFYFCSKDCALEYNQLNKGLE